MNLKKYSKYSILVIIFTFFFVNLFFYSNSYWSKLISKKPSSTNIGEVQATEWGFEKIYQKVISGENPFSSFNDINYPFGIDTVGGDIGTVFLYPLFRPIFSSHQTLIAIVLLGIFLANLGMYLLIRKLNISKEISFIIALAYGFMTFTLPRGGHPVYISSIFLFPWFYLAGISFLQSTNTYKKLLHSTLIAFLYVLTLWMNSYYFIILSLSLVFIFIYFLIKERKKLLNFLINNFGFIIFSGLLFIFLNIPWFMVFYNTFLFSELPKSFGWGGSIFYSSDLFGYFIPSKYNYYYGNLVAKVTSNVDFAKDIFEQFTYPGIIIIVSYVYLLFRYKKIPSKLKKLIKPYLYTSIGFFFLTLGPFLHVFGRWYITVDERIRLYFPLPFIGLHYIPFLDNIRVPGRLIVGFIFFAYIVVAYITTHLLKSKSKKFKTIFLICLFMIFIFDHKPQNNKIKNTPISVPNNIYNTIKKDGENISVLQVPFVIRDGFTYFGDYNSVSMTLAQSYYNKPTIGIYTGRLPDYIKEYFRQDPFVGFLGRQIDEDLTKNPYMLGTDFEAWRNIDFEKAKESVDFLSLKYVILDEKRKFSESVENTLEKLEFHKSIIQGKYSLWVRKPKSQDFIDINIIRLGYNRNLGMGWYPAENEFRWSARRSSILFKINKPKKLILKFKAATFYKNLKLTIYINKKKVKTFVVETEPKEYTVILDKNLKKGINMVYFIFNEGFRPSDIIKGSMDNRKLSAQFTEIVVY